MVQTEATPIAATLRMVIKVFLETIKYLLKVFPTTSLFYRQFLDKKENHGQQLL
jgi:hypothetical protein